MKDNNTLTEWILSKFYSFLEKADNTPKRTYLYNFNQLIYPRYFGYYDKAVGIYTHVSDQYSVFSTKVISCSPREALYVLDGLLENNTILNVTEHTTDTAGFTEHIFALCYLLGFYFMPRIRDLKDQQLYKLDAKDHMGDFNVLIRKTVNLNLIEEQWDQMVRVAASLKERLTP